MADPYLGEIRIFGGNFAPVGWAFCDGGLLQISDYTALFTLLGTTYGGDGQTTFALPDLRSRLPVHQGTGFIMGQQGGAEKVTLQVAQLPAHTHTAQGAAAGTANTPNGNVWAGSAAIAQFVEGTVANESMAPGAMGKAGGGGDHDNMVPYLGINFIISLFGIYPSRT